LDCGEVKMDCGAGSFKNDEGVVGLREKGKILNGLVWGNSYRENGLLECLLMKNTMKVLKCFGKICCR